MKLIPGWFAIPEFSACQKPLSLRASANTGVAISKCKGVRWITQRTRFGLKIMIVYYFRSLISFDTINE